MIEKILTVKTMLAIIILVVLQFCGCLFFFLGRKVDALANSVKESLCLFVVVVIHWYNIAQEHPLVKHCE